MKCEELRAALGEACALGEQGALRVGSVPHQRFGELRMQFLPTKLAVRSSAWITQKIIAAQKMQARAYEIVQELRKKMADLT